MSRQQCPVVHEWGSIDPTIVDILPKLPVWGLGNGDAGYGAIWDQAGGDGCKRHGAYLSVLEGHGEMHIQYGGPSAADVTEAEAQLGLRVVGTLPQMKEVQSGRRGNGALWTEAGMESFLLRSPTHQELRRIAIQLRSRDANPVRSLLVTSACSGEGKTTTSILLAATIAAENPEEKVLLVEVDFRRSSLARILGLDKGADGAAQALETGRFDERVVQASLPSNLYVLPLGPMPASRHNLPRSESFSLLIPELLNRYGFVVIDTAPNLAIPDSLVIGQHVDAVLFVVRAGSTPRSLVERAIDLQRQFKENLWGVLMNYVDEAMPYSYDYKRYGYSYGARDSGVDRRAST